MYVFKSFPPFSNDFCNFQLIICMTPCLARLPPLLSLLLPYHEKVAPKFSNAPALENQIPNSIGIGISLFFLLCPIPIGHFYFVSNGFQWKTNYFPMELDKIFQWNPLDSNYFPMDSNTFQLEFH